MALTSSFSLQGATPHSPMGSNPTSNGSTPQARALNGATGVPSAPLPMPLMPPVHQPVKSHTITHPDGTSIVQTYHNPLEQKTPGLLANTPSQASKQSIPSTPMPEIKFMDGKHHVPYKKADGSYGFIDAEGNTH